MRDARPRPRRHAARACRSRPAPHPLPAIGLCSGRPRPRQLHLLCRAPPLPPLAAARRSLTAARLLRHRATSAAMRQKGGRSKRDRKAKATNSLRHKRNASSLEALPDADLARCGAAGACAARQLLPRCCCCCRHRLLLTQLLRDPHCCRLLDDTNAEILPARGADGDAPAAADGAATDAAEPAPPQRQLSKSQQRKLRRIQEEKEKRERRADVMATLAQHQARRCC